MPVYCHRCREDSVSVCFSQTAPLPPSAFWVSPESGVVCGPKNDKRIASCLVCLPLVSLMLTGGTELHLHDDLLFSVLDLRVQPLFGVSDVPHGQATSHTCLTSRGPTRSRNMRASASRSARLVAHLWSSHAKHFASQLVSSCQRGRRVQEGA